MKKPYDEPRVEQLRVHVIGDVLTNSDVDINIDDLFDTELDIPGGALFN